MRSDDDEMNWWIDLPKLITITTEGRYSYTFQYPRSITLESILFHSILTNRHARSYHCCSWQRKGFPLQENRSHEESLLLPSLISRHLSRSFRLPLLSSFFHTYLSSTPDHALLTAFSTHGKDITVKDCSGINPHNAPLHPHDAWTTNTSSKQSHSHSTIRNTTLQRPRIYHWTPFPTSTLLHRMTHMCERLDRNRNPANQRQVS